MAVTHNFQNLMDPHFKPFWVKLTEIGNLNTVKNFYLFMITPYSLILTTSNISETLTEPISFKWYVGNTNLREIFYVWVLTGRKLLHLSQWRHPKLDVILISWIVNFKHILHLLLVFLLRHLYSPIIFTPSCTFFLEYFLILLIMGNIKG